MIGSIFRNKAKWTIADGFNTFLVCLLGLILLVRLSFLGAGAITFPDEGRYYESVEAAESLFKGALSGFNNSLSQTQGRPGDALLRVVPASLQLLLSSLTGISPHSTASLTVPAFINYLIVLGSLVVFYRIAQLLLRHKTAALLTTLVYSCMVNTNIYIRHILPYDTALFLVLVAFYWILRLRQQPELRTNRVVFCIGALVGLSFTVYPGYNAAVVVAGLLVLERLMASENSTILAFDLKRLFGAGVFYSLGVLAVLMFFQLLSRANGSSYFEDCIGLSGTIKQGDFADGFMFLPKYLFQAEQSLGYLLAGLAILAVPVGLWSFFRERISLNRVVNLISDNLLIIAMVLAYLWYAVMVYYLEKMVFYGRILHFYFPFMLLLLAKVLYPATRRSWQYIPAAVVAGVAMYSFFVFTVDYHRIAYPVTFMLKHADEFIGTKLTMQDQSTNANSGDYYLVRDAALARPPVAGQPEVVLVNMAFLYPIKEAKWCNEIVLPQPFKIIYSEPHFLTLPAYQFEGYTIAERDIISRCQYKCLVYQKK
jgi:hypothetical protein